jgi:hypothetical protein
MTWKQEINWHGYRLILTRDQSEPEPQTSPALAPAPGAGEIKFPAMYLFSDGESIHLEAEICGKKIARVSLEVLREMEDGWLVGPICLRELKAPQRKEIGGVEIPIWADTNLLSATWLPAMSLLVNGDDTACAFFKPAQSNANEKLLLTLRITGDKEQSVHLHFSEDGNLSRMTELDRGSRGLRPQPGDQLIPAATWLRPDGENWQYASGSSNAITITDQPLHLKEIPAPPGRYHIGLLVHDLDGQTHRGMITFEIPVNGLGEG